MFSYLHFQRPTLILNVDGLIGVSMVDLLRNCGCFSRKEADEFIRIGTLNGLFVLARSIGFIGELMGLLIFLIISGMESSRWCMFCHHMEHILRRTVWVSWSLNKQSLLRDIWLMTVSTGAVLVGVLSVNFVNYRAVRSSTRVLQNGNAEHFPCYFILLFLLLLSLTSDFLWLVVCFRLNFN